MLSDPSAQAYLNGLKAPPTEHDPALFLDWNVDVLEQFVREANRVHSGSVGCVQAPFITTAPGIHSLFILCLLCTHISSIKLLLK